MKEACKIICDLIAIERMFVINDIRRLDIWCEIDSHSTIKRYRFFKEITQNETFSIFFPPSSSPLYVFLHPRINVARSQYDVVRDEN